MNNIREASYIEGEIDEYKNHPLINALPPINSPQAVARAINRYTNIHIYTTLPNTKKTLLLIPMNDIFMNVDVFLHVFLFPSTTHRGVKLVANCLCIFYRHDVVFIDVGFVLHICQQVAFLPAR